MKPYAAVLLFVVAATSPEIKYFQYERPVQNTPQNAAQACLVLDSGIFAHAASELADLRLYRDHMETPYVIRMAAPLQVSEKSVTPMNLGLRAGQTVFDAAMPEGNYSDLELAVTGQDFIAAVTVSGSQDQTGSAETKLGSYTIFDLTHQRLGRSTVLHLPESDFRYLHFQIAGPLLPQSITGLSVERLPASQPKYETVAESSHITQNDHSSVLEFTVPAHVPVDRIVFTPGAKPASFSRNVSISVTPILPPPATNAAVPPQPLMSSGSLLRIHSAQSGHRIDEERLTVEAPNADFNTQARWKVVIENGDDAPLELKSVRIEMLQRTLCFEAVGNASYMLFYGDSALVAPHYDYATLFTPQVAAAQVAVGPEERNPEYQARPDARPFTERHPALLWVALIAVIALLGGIALQSVKRSTPKP